VCYYGKKKLKKFSQLPIIVIKPGPGVDPVKKPGSELHGSTQKKIKKYLRF
jgi:hypothetical protein